VPLLILRCPWIAKPFGIKPLHGNIENLRDDEKLAGFQKADLRLDFCQGAPRYVHAQGLAPSGQTLLGETNLVSDVPQVRSHNIGRLGIVPHILLLWLSPGSRHRFRSSILALFPPNLEQQLSLLRLWTNITAVP